MDGRRQLLLMGQPTAPPPPPSGTIGDPAILVNAYDHTNTVDILNAATSVDIPAGRTLVAFSVLGSGAVTVSFAGGGVAFTMVEKNHGLAGRMRMFYGRASALIPSGTIFTLDWTNTAKGSFNLFAIEGLADTAPLDINAGPETGAQATNLTSLALASGAPSQSSVLLMPVTTVWDNVVVDHGAGISGLAQAGGVGGNNVIAPAFKKVSDGSGIAYNPTWATGQAAGCSIFGFKGA